MVWPVYLPGKDNPPPLSFPLSSTPALATTAAPKVTAAAVVATAAIPIDVADARCTSSSTGDENATPNLSDSSRSELSSSAEGDGGIESAVEAAKDAVNCSVTSATTDEFSDLADAVDEEREKEQFDDDDDDEEDCATDVPDSGGVKDKAVVNASEPQTLSLAELCPSLFPPLPAPPSLSLSKKVNDERSGSAGDLMRASITSTSTIYAPASEKQCPICFRRRDPTARQGE